MLSKPHNRRLSVWMNGIHVGYWGTTNRQHVFQYDAQWSALSDACPLSLSMPVQASDEPHGGPVVEAFFDHLLPDNPDARRAIQARFGAATLSAFDLLTEVGGDCIGAIRILPENRAVDEVQHITGEPLSESSVSATIRSVVSKAAADRRSSVHHVALPGAQAKTALLWHDDQWCRPTGATPTTHIFKLPLGRVGNMQADLSTSVENEWLCAQIVREFGMPVADCEIADFEDQHVLIVKRFDRKLSRSGRWWLRLPQEDMCQATGTPRSRRYESDGGPGVADICSLLLGSRRAARDRRDFFKAQVLFWMLCAIDGHAKNFSVFIEPQGRYVLTPLYDVMSAYPVLGKGANQVAPQKARMAMAVTGKNRHYKWAGIQPRHWLSMAASVGLDANAHEDLHALASRASTVVDTVADKLPTEFPKQVADPIFDGLLDTARRLATL